MLLKQLFSEAFRFLPYFYKSEAIIFFWFWLNILFLCMLCISNFTLFDQIGTREHDRILDLLLLHLCSEMHYAPIAFITVQWRI